ncbi:predicted protein [Naegleria gruberi]|uniref:Predicted protein n=1 Tax=Naegleria gruberi TaxID=5762 RepID=D2VBX7_NAEGR|nr:uncharacterized protein NAEGRDRAFT_66372 [Naegleria gruberi]EFC45555.1 predicted protein [Naegleria gruberi]|eukprot:XP_002678299.1 predicted protein [Naegleria gruberi strain NEG-M]
MFSDHENVDQQTFLCTYRKNIIGLDFGNTSLSYRDACLIAKFESLEELIGEVGDEMEALVDYLPNLKSLDVGLVQEICYENVEYISELQNLTTFSIRYSNIGRKHLQIIGEMSQLTDLNISGNPINSLLPIRPLTRITSLSAADCSFLGDDGIYPIVNFKGLQKLNLSSNGITWEGCMFISEKFPNLSHLSLNETRICDGAIKRLSKMKQLTYLDVGNNAKITMEGIKLISNNLTNLTHLNISSNNVTDEGLMMACDLPKLQELFVGHNQITDSGINEFSEKIGNKLKILSLSRNNITSLCTQYLCTKLTNLKKLYLAGVSITDEDVKLICQCMKLLIYLDVSWNNVTDKSLEYVIASESLREVDVNGNEQIHDTNWSKIGKL